MYETNVVNERYKDILGTDIPNCSWLKRLPYPCVVVGQVIGELFNPVSILIAIEIFIVALHYLDIKNNDIIKQRFIEVHHLCVMPMCGVVGLYMIFKQRRPTYDVQAKRQIGTLYGMPSGDSMLGAILGCYMSENIFVRVLPMILVSYSRVARGFHSLAQVLIGTLTGVILYVLQKLYGDKLCLFIWLFSFFTPFLVLFDPALKKTEQNDSYNLYGWLFLDLVSLSFDYCVIGPDKYNCFSSLSFGFRFLMFIIFSIITTTFGNYICERGVVLSLV